MSVLHLVRLPLDLRRLTEWALDRGYLSVPAGDGRGRPRHPDLGYALHAYLSGLFGEQSPRPFAIPPMGQRRGSRATSARYVKDGGLDLLGYARLPIQSLRTLAQLSDASLQSVINWNGAGSKPMPTLWPRNLRLRFDLRACPVRRIMKPITTTSRPGLPRATFSKGSEVDAYQLAAIRARDSGCAIPSRSEVYIEWLAQRLGASPGRVEAVSLVPRSVQIESYRSTRLLRRPRASSGGRSSRWLTRPEVRFTGLLEVVDPEAMPALLTSGIGRHCGFGFGMLLLRPA